MNLQVSQAFNLTSRGMATFIRNVKTGLPENTILYSEERDLKWKVMYRLLWMHSAHAVTRFSNEKEIIGHASFKYSLNEDPVKTAIETEIKLGYEYLLLPINHGEKPLDGEYIIVKT